MPYGSPKKGAGCEKFWSTVRRCWQTLAAAGPRPSAIGRPLSKFRAADDVAHRSNIMARYSLTKA